MASSEHCNLGAIIHVCPAGLYFATWLQMKGHLVPAQCDNTTRRKKFSFNFPSCLTSWHFHLFLQHILKKFLLAKPQCKRLIQLCDHPAPLCIYHPSPVSWHSLVQRSSHWETPVLKADLWEVGMGTLGK